MASPGFSSRQLLGEHRRRDAAADDADVGFVDRHRERPTLRAAAEARSVRVLLGSGQPAARVAADRRAVAEILRRRRIEVVPHQVGGDVRAGGTGREALDLGFGDRRFDDGAALIERRGGEAGGALAPSRRCRAPRSARRSCARATDRSAARACCRSRDRCRRLPCSWRSTVKAVTAALRSASVGRTTSAIAARSAGSSLPPEGGSYENQEEERHAAAPSDFSASRLEIAIPPPSSIRRIPAPPPTRSLQR